MKLLEEDAEQKGFGKDEGRKSFYRSVLFVPIVSFLSLKFPVRRFRVFFLACAEFFAMDRGETWGLGHYLYEIHLVTLSERALILTNSTVFQVREALRLGETADVPD
jgi:hypothetical protein